MQPGSPTSGLLSCFYFHFIFDIAYNLIYQERAPLAGWTADVPSAVLIAENGQY